MKGFAFSLARDAYLREDIDGFHLISRHPPKMLRVNRSLFQLLNHIQTGGELAGFHELNPGLDRARVLRTLLSLVAKDYLKLETIAELVSYPAVSIIVPVHNQPGDLRECLASLQNLDYPRNRREIIVVDDGSREELSPEFSSPNIRVIRQAEPGGPAAARNTGAAGASGEIFAFLDADCVAGKSWLRELVPFFQAAGLGAAGGYIEGYRRRTLLDRYESAASPLNMGNRLRLEGKTVSTFYVPTANMLVTRECFMSTDGFNSRRRLGEDVDFCWRLRQLGYSLLYIPAGSVAHKHRNRPGEMLRRRFQYGTSEASLYRAHCAKKKTFVFPVFAGLSFLALAMAILLLNPYPLAAMPLLFLADLWHRSAASRKIKTSLAFMPLAGSAFRTHFSFIYFACFHLVRYYLVLIIGLGFLWYPFWFFGGLAVIDTSAVDYRVKKPELLYPVFLFFYILEHLAYQLGVLLGCVRAGYFGSYRLAFRSSGF